jgi:hypothetical protein
MIHESGRCNCLIFFEAIIYLSGKDNHHLAPPSGDVLRFTVKCGFNHFAELIFCVL